MEYILPDNGSLLIAAELGGASASNVVGTAIAPQYNCSMQVCSYSRDVPNLLN